MTTTRRALFLRGSTTLDPTYWRGSQSASSVPVQAILAEDGDPILTEFGEYLETES